MRELARRVGVSASMISQIELGRVMPSVPTLSVIVTALEASLDDVVFAGAGSPARASGPGPVLRRSERRALILNEGVTWESLTATTDPELDFMLATYAPGGESAAPDGLHRHGGKEYGWVVRGQLCVTLGPETFEMRRGDSISFDSTTPHRLYNPGDKDAQVVWVVLGGEGGPRPVGAP